MSDDSKFKSYSPDLVTCTLAGILLNEGLADGEFFTVEPEADDWGDKVGTDGEVVRFRGNDQRATVKFKLMHSSGINGRLSALRNLDVNSPNGAGVGIFEMRDRNTEGGAVIVRATKSWIKKLPNVARAREVSDLEWTIRLATAKWNIQGNPAL